MAHAVPLSTFTDQKPPLSAIKLERELWRDDGKKRKIEALERALDAMTQERNRCARKLGESEARVVAQASKITKLLDGLEDISGCLDALLECLPRGPVRGRRTPLPARPPPPPRRPRRPQQEMVTSVANKRRRRYERALGKLELGEGSTFAPLEGKRARKPVSYADFDSK